MTALQRFGRFPLYLSTPIAAIIAALVTGLAHLIIGDLEASPTDSGSTRRAESRTCSSPRRCLQHSSTS